jgi:hypothetical protein
VRPCVFMGNHQSMVDVFVLGACVTSAIYLLHRSDHTDSVFPTGTRGMSKRSLKYMPFFGQFLQVAGPVRSPCSHFKLPERISRSITPRFGFSQKGHVHHALIMICNHSRRVPFTLLYRQAFRLFPWYLRITGTCTTRAFSTLALSK